MTALTSKIENKRARAFIRIGQNAIGAGMAAAVPTPALETAKMLGIAVADAWMFWEIYQIYYERELSSKQLSDLLGNAGIIVFTGGAIGYASLRISQTVINEFLNVVPVLGWVVAGAITGTSTLAVGLAWQVFVEENYRIDRKIALGGVVNIPVLVNPELVIEEEASRTQTEAASDRILTMHPEGKEGVHIEREKYDLIREHILDVMNETDSDMALKDVIRTIEKHIGGTFEGSVSWYVTTVKLDLEAHDIIERLPNTSPQVIRLKNA